MHAQRKESIQQGVDVLKEPWMSSKTQHKLLRADIASRPHYPCERVRKSTAGVEKGFLTVGETSVVFLREGTAPATASEIVLSHPISMLASYMADGDSLVYSLKKHHFVGHSEILDFRYNCYSVEQVAKIIAALDATMLLNTKLAEKDTDADDLHLLDPEVRADFKRGESTVSVEVTRMAGERFKCDAVYFNDKPHFFDHAPEKESVLAIINARGIALLHHLSNALEIFSWAHIVRFGPKTHHTTDDTFSFVVNQGTDEHRKEETISLTSPHALNMHALSVKYTQIRATVPDFHPPAFPASYKPEHEA